MLDVPTVDGLMKRAARRLHSILELGVINRHAPLVLLLIDETPHATHRATEIPRMRQTVRWSYEWLQALRKRLDDHQSCREMFRNLVSTCNE